MSRASEWSKRFQATRRDWPKRFIDPRQGTDQPGPYIGLGVDELGRCRVETNDQWVATLPPAVIVAAARWALAMFEDEQ